MDGTLEDRLAALERAVTDGDHDCSALAEGAATADRLAEIEADLADLADRVAELEAATQALRGYVGNVRSVNSDVEERADLALSKAEAARQAVDQAHGHAAETSPRATDGTGTQSGEPAPTDGDDRDRQRCRHCERPLEDGQRENTPRESSETEFPERVAAPSDLEADTGGLDALREPTDRRSEVPRGMAGTQTDGGRPEQPSTGNATNHTDHADEKPDAGVLSRVRSLL